VIGKSLYQENSQLDYRDVFLIALGRRLFSENCHKSIFVVAKIETPPKQLSALDTTHRPQHPDNLLLKPDTPILRN